jgi:hypothetical protein
MAEKDDRSFGEWFSDLLGNPVSGGAKGICFYLVALPFMIVCGVLGLMIFPPGTYPIIVLIIPGAILGMIVLYIYALILYIMPTFLGVPLSIAFSVLGFYFVVTFAGAIIQQF